MTTTIFSSLDRSHRTFSSTSIGPSRRSIRQPEAVYRRRRVVVGGVTAIMAAISIVTAHDVLVGSGGVPASAATGQLARSSVVAQPGDTLWSIASEYRGDAAMSRYVDVLVDLNDGASIEAGQRIILP